MMSPGPTVWMVATSMAARPYASTGRASGPWSVRTSSLWAFIELRMARSSRKSGSPSAISKANRSKGRRTGLKTRRSDTFSVFERARWLASTSRMLPGFLRTAERPFENALWRSSDAPFCASGLNPLQPQVRRWRQGNGDRVAGLHRAAFQNDGHDARFQHQAALGIAAEHRLHQARLEAVDLD